MVGCREAAAFGVYRLWVTKEWRARERILFESVMLMIYCLYVYVLFSGLIDFSPTAIRRR